MSCDTARHRKLVVCRLHCLGDIVLDGHLVNSKGKNLLTDTAGVISVNGRRGKVILTKEDVGLGQVQNLSPSQLFDDTELTGETRIESVTVTGTSDFDGQTTISNQIFPISDGLPGQVLTTDGAGMLSWAAGGGAVDSVNGATGAVNLNLVTPFQEWIGDGPHQILADGPTNNVVDGITAPEIILPVAPVSGSFFLVVNGDPDIDLLISPGAVTHTIIGQAPGESIGIGDSITTFIFHGGIWYFK